MRDIHPTPHPKTYLVIMDYLRIACPKKPNPFWRLIQYLLLGWKWEDIKDA